MAERRSWFWLLFAVLLTSKCAAACPNEFDVIPEEKYNRDPSSVDDTLRRPLGFKYAIALYEPTQGQSDPCAYLTNLTDRAVEVSGADFTYCWPAKNDKVSFTFYCDTAEGCDTDTQFWYRLTPSVGDVDDWCNERPGDFPNSLIQLPTAPVGLTTKVPSSGACDPSNTVGLTSILLTLFFLAISFSLL